MNGYSKNWTEGFLSEINMQYIHTVGQLIYTWYVGQPNDFFVIGLLKEKLSTIAYESPRHPSNVRKNTKVQESIFLGMAQET